MVSYIYVNLPRSDIVKLSYWHLLHKNRNPAEIFQNPSIFAFRKNKSLRYIIGTKLIENGTFKKNFTNKIQGKCTPCLANNKTLCCNQFVHTKKFRKNQTSRIFQIHHNLNCKSNYVNYLLEYTKRKIQYVGKLKQSSILDSITTKRIYRNQTL